MPRTSPRRSQTRLHAEVATLQSIYDTEHFDLTSTITACLRRAELLHKIIAYYMSRRQVRRIRSLQSTPQALDELQGFNVANM